MVHPISIQVREQVIQLGLQVSELERQIGNAGDDPQAAMDQLCHVEEIRESYNTTRTLAKQVQGIAQDILADLKALKPRILVLEAQRDSLSLEDTFQELGSPLQDRAQGALDANEPFHVKIFNIYLDRERIHAELQSQGQNRHQIADHIETELKDRITNLSNEATNPGESDQVNEFLMTNENLHCGYFDEQLQELPLTGDNETDFNALLPLFSSLRRFASERNFILVTNKERMEDGSDTLLATLRGLIELQRATESVE